MINSYNYMNDKAHLANIDVKIYVLWQYRELP